MYIQNKSVPSQDPVTLPAPRPPWRFIVLTPSRIMQALMSSIVGKELLSGTDGGVTCLKPYADLSDWGSDRAECY